MKRWIALSLLLAPLLASAASFWDGNATIQRGDSTFESGLFAVSNSFSTDTDIVLENLETGKKTPARVVGRIEDQQDLLVLLSPKTAQALDIAQGSIARVRITLAPRTAAATTPPGEERKLSADPDVNPAADFSAAAEPSAPDSSEAATVSATTVPGNDNAGENGVGGSSGSDLTETSQQPTVESIQETSAAEQNAPPIEVTFPEAPPAEELAVSETVSETETAQTTPEQPAEEEPASVIQPSAEDAAALSEAAGRTPQKQLFLPPREDQKFVYRKPLETPVQAAETQVAQAEVEPETQPEIQAEEQVAQAEEQVAQAEEQPETQPATPEIASVNGEMTVLIPAETAAGIPLTEAELPPESRPEDTESLSLAAPAIAAGVLIALASPEPLPVEQKPEKPAPVQTDVSSVVPEPAATRELAKLALLFPEVPQPAAVQVAAASTTNMTAASQVPSTPVQATPQAAATESQAVTLTTLLPAAKLPRTVKPDTWYLQLGAYSTEKIAQDLASSLSPTYPIVMLAPQSSGRGIYRVLVGPLNRAESGTLLSWFRARGFPDAFTKQAE